MSKNEYAVEIENLGKMYKLYKNPKDKVLDAFGLGFLKKNYYKEFWALRGVNIKIKKGERVGIIGHNGAGKSTFLKMVIGNIEPTEGKIDLNGKVQALMELGTGFHPDFTGRENIRASLAYHGLSHSVIMKKEEEIIDFAELGDYIEQPVKTYSAGMYARLAFSTATAIEPELLIIDEVLGAGDAYFSGKCIERMKNITANDETTVLFVSHDLGSVQALCERIIWIDKGQVRYDGDPLIAIKQYSDVVREHQENRLKIRDKKVQEKQAIILDKDEELYTSILFRIHAIGDACAKIRKLRLICGEQELGSIEVGMPMDNDNKAKNSILEEKEIMCWGESKKDEVGFFRLFDNKLGSYGHAPFSMAVSKAISLSEMPSLVMEGEFVTGENLLIDYYDKEQEKYITIGEIQSNKGDFSCNFELDEIYKSKKEKVTEVEFQDSDKCRIYSAEVIGRDNIAHKVFAFEEQISKFQFKIEFEEKLERFYFAFCVFTMYGEMIISQCREALINGDKDVTIDINMDELRLGPGVYTLSFGVYDEMDVTDNSKPQTAIALIDRGLSFEISKSLQYQLNIGNVLPDLRISISGEKEGEIKCSSMV